MNTSEKTKYNAYTKKCYKYLWQKCLEPEIIAEAWCNARKGKARRQEVFYIESHFDDCVLHMREMIFNTRPGGDLSKSFHPVKHKPKHRYESGKIRETYCPTMWEQWLHHILILVLKPIFMKYSYPFSCGSVPNKGGYYAKREIERAIRKRKGFKYYMKIDIRHFFAHVGIEFVIKELKRIIDDEWLFFLIRRMFKYFHKGLPLGFYPSQWFCNYILCPLDWMIRKKRPKCYIRYVDDMIIAGNNKNVLRKMLYKIQHYIGHRLHLKLKRNYQIIRFDYVYISGKRIGRPIDFVGYEFYRDKTIIRRSSFYRTKRFIKRLHHQRIISCKQAQSAISRIGIYKHTDTRYAWYSYIQPCISVRSLKRIISKYQRRCNDENRLDRGVLFLRTQNVCKTQRFCLSSAA